MGATGACRIREFAGAREGDVSRLDFGWFVAVMLLVDRGVYVLLVYFF